MAVAEGRDRVIVVLLLGLGCGGGPSGTPSASSDEGTSTGLGTTEDPMTSPDVPGPAPADDGTDTEDPEPPPVPPDLGPVLPPPDPPGPPQQAFVDVTAVAGLQLDPGPLVGPPFCLLATAHDPPGYNGYCAPERFLGAAAAGDFDGDGWPDLYLTRMDGPGRLMRNQGDGTFADVAAAAGLELAEAVGGAAWLDVEGDGDLDLLLTRVGGTRHHLYVNDGAGAFTEQAQARGAAVETAAVHVGMGIGVGDLDRDGYLDVFVADWRNSLVLGPGPDHNRLLRNLGPAAPGSFEDVTAAMGIDLAAITFALTFTPGAFGFAPAFADLDDDGWPELTLTADFGTSRLYWNDGPGGLHDGTLASGVGTETNGMGSAFGDIDGDGDLDWFVSSIWLPGTPDDGNRLYRNEGDRSFTDVTDAVGVREGGWGWSAAFFDVDLDGDLDLAQAAGWPATPFSTDPPRLWLNPGHEAGTDEDAAPWPEVAAARGLHFPGQGRGLVPFDYDRDGDLDLLLVGNTEPPALYRNDVTGGAWLEVRAAGTGGNSQGLGARVRVQAEPSGPWQVRWIGVGGHLFGQGEAVAHFGLPPGPARLPQVEVTWPASGRQVILTDVDRNQRLEVSE